MDDRYIEIISRLRAIRTAKGLSQSELAQKLNKDQTFVSKIENGTRNIGVIELLDWADALNADICLLLKFSD